MVTIKFDTDNAAFEEEYDVEISWVLRRIREHIIADIWGPGFGEGIIRDSNGNNIGRWTYTQEEQG